MYHIHAYSTCRGQKRVSNPLELIIVVSSQVGAGVLWKSISAL